jgi:hypothetical protein
MKNSVEQSIHCVSCVPFVFDHRSSPGVIPDGENTFFESALVRFQWG